MPLRELANLLGRDQCRVIRDGDVGDERRRPFHDLEHDLHLLLAQSHHARVHLRVAKALAVVEDPNAQDVALELLPIQVVTLDEAAIWKESAERR